jgi:hypothetical protein
MESRNDHGGAELPSWVWIWFPPILFLMIPLARLLDPEFHQTYFNMKEGPIEWATVIVLIPGIVGGAWAFSRREVLPPGRVRKWLFLMTLGAFYFAGEEMSWGQQLFHWDSPEFFAEHNRQSETNLHNFSSLFGRKLRILCELFALVGGVIIPLRAAKKHTDPAKPGHWFWPTRVCIPVASLAILTYMPDRWEDTFGEFESPFWASLRLSEPQEYYFALFITIYLLSIAARVKRLQRAA